LAKSPDFALAFAGQSFVWACRQQIGFVPPSEAGPRAKAAALRAIELDDTTADAHLALAVVLSWTDWDFAAAEPEWRRAIELDPSNAWALAGHSHFLMITGRPEEALTQIERALSRDPFNVIVTSFHAVDLVLVRRYDEAIEAARAALRIQPEAPVALNALGAEYIGVWPHFDSIRSEPRFRELLRKMKLPMARSGHQ
jgi:tetratricopeptide (TPR) repeat protein